MKPYYEDDLVTLFHGDCIEVMRTLPDGSTDSIVTDPPYGLGFMGKAWDALPPGEDWARECLRVLKPGGYLLAFGGTRTWHRLAVAVEDAGFEIRDSIAWMYGQGFPKGKAQLKPAFEPVVMARKKTDAPRTGLLQIEASRIEGQPRMTRAAGSFSTGKVGYAGGWRTQMQHEVPAGRWPSNVILDEAMATALDGQSGLSRSPKTVTDDVRKQPATPVSFGAGRRTTENSYGDTGGASRFFYVAKATKKERPVVNGIAHTTVKPLALMRHLVRLVTPEGGTALDPFAGSGTTIEAAVLEGFNVIGIEREADYLPLIHARIDRTDHERADRP